MWKFLHSLPVPSFCSVSHLVSKGKLPDHLAPISSPVASPIDPIWHSLTPSVQHLSKDEHTTQPGPMFGLPTFSLEMCDIITYLSRVAFVQLFGHLVKVDDFRSTLANKTWVPSSQTTRWIAKEHEFFVSCPSFEVVQGLIEMGHIYVVKVSLWQ